MNVSFIKTDTHISIIFDDGTHATVYSSNPLYTKFVDAIKTKDWDTAKNIAFPVTQVRQKHLRIHRTQVPGA